MSERNPSRWVEGLGAGQWERIAKALDEGYGGPQKWAIGGETLFARRYGHRTAQRLSIVGSRRSRSATLTAILDEAGEFGQQRHDEEHGVAQATNGQGWEVEIADVREWKQPDREGFAEPVLAWVAWLTFLTDNEGLEERLSDPGGMEHSAVHDLAAGWSEDARSLASAFNTIERNALGLGIKEVVHGRSMDSTGNGCKNTRIAQPLARALARTAVLTLGWFDLVIEREGEEQVLTAWRVDATKALRKSQWRTSEQGVGTILESHMLMEIERCRNPKNIDAAGRRKMHVEDLAIHCSDYGGQVPRNPEGEIWEELEIVRRGFEQCFADGAFPVGAGEPYSEAIERVDEVLRSELG